MSDIERKLFDHKFYDFEMINHNAPMSVAKGRVGQAKVGIKINTDGSLTLHTTETTTDTKRKFARGNKIDLDAESVNLLIQALEEKRGLYSGNLDDEYY